VNNLCSAPILIDTEHDSFEHQSSYFYIGHFSRFIKPGARRILCAATRAALECTAFVNPAGDIAIVVMNRLDNDQAFQIQLGGASYPTELPGHSIATYLLDAPKLS
jgi:glucosylceramidase